MPLIPVTWRDQLTVNATTANSQSDPDVIQLANGNILVSWTTNDPGGLGSPTGTETFAQIFDPLGNKIGGEIRLNNASTGGDEQNADLAATPTGGFIAVYHDLDNPPTSPFGGSNIRLEEFDATGNLVASNPLVVLDSGTGADPNYRNPRVAVAGATSALVVYEEFTTTGTKIVGKIYNPGTDTFGSQLTLINASGIIDGVPDIAVLENGNYVIAANYNFGGDNAINYTIITSAGAGVKNATFVVGTSTDAENDREVSVAALAQGGFVISWTNTDANDTDILFRVYDNAGTQIASGSAGDDGTTNLNNESKVIALADGTFVIAWDRDGPSPLGVYVQHFSATGVPLGDQFTPFAVSADNANNISAVGLADGRFALVWDQATAEISMEILDTRDAPNNPGVYGPDPWQVGTRLDDVLVLAAATRNAGGGLGDDEITGNGNANLLRGDVGDDILRGNGGADTLDGGAGFDQLFGDDGSDTASYQFSSAAISINLATGVVGGGEAAGDILSSIENVLGSVHSDSLTGNALNNTLTGATGNDSLVGLDGNDTLNGNGNNDFLDGGAGSDTLNGGIDNDTYQLGGDATGVDTLSDTGGVDTVRSTITRSLQTWAFIEILILEGGGTINGTGNGAANTIFGNGGSNVITGQGSNDTILGGGGNDWLYGQVGRDSLKGEAGNDRFALQSVNDSLPGAANRDLVYDFDKNGDDLFDFSAVPGITTFVGLNGFTAPGQVRVQQVGADVLIQLNTVGNSVAEAEMLALNTTIGNGVNQLNSGDFVL